MAVEIREILRIKKGAGGLDPPQNIGILLEREREGKEYTATLFTLKGRVRLRSSSLKGSTGRIYEGDKSDEKAMAALLRSEIERLDAKDVLKMDPETIIDTLKPGSLWRSVMDHLKVKGISSPSDIPGLSAEEISRIHYYPQSLTPRQIKAVEKVLYRTEPAREPFFRRSGSEGIPLFIPYSEEIIAAIEDHARRLEGLKTAFVGWVEEEREDGSIYRSPVPRSEDISAIELDEDQARELDELCDWGLAYLENGRWVQKATPLDHRQGIAHPVGLAGTPVWRLERFELERYLSFFFKDLPASRSDDLPSNILLALLKLRRITWLEASELVVRYRIATGASKFHRVFPEYVKRASEAIPSDVCPDDLTGRIDLRGLETYTIDPPDAKDFDDAISIERSGDRTVVYVHIADVTHYVRPDDPSDLEARFRATSVYLPSGVLPMLPPKLSEDLCSLREGRDRLAVTVRIELDSDFGTVGYRFMPSVIRVRRNLSYDTAEGLIVQGVDPFASLHRISEGLGDRYHRLDLRSPERRVRFDGTDSLSAVLKRPTIATKLIEELMVLANECAADLLEKNGVATPFRVHPIPEAGGIGRFNAACDVLGLDIRLTGAWASTGNPGMSSPKGNGSGEEAMIKALLTGGKLQFGSFMDTSGIKAPDGVEPDKRAGVDRERMDAALDEMNEVLARVHDLPEEWMRDLLSSVLLRSMPKAFYSTENIGHFGLRSERYCHFTSPIRRYADILVHRGIKAIHGDEGEWPGVTWYPLEEENVGPMIENINEMSESAEAWERQMVDVAIATKLAMSGGPLALTGRITSITPGSCYVTMDDGLTEGRLSMRSMSRFKLTPDEDQSRVHLFIDENMDRDLSPDLLRSLAEGGGSIVVFKVGDRVRCTIHSISLAEGKVELSLQE